MESQPTIRLVNGPFDGIDVDDDAGAEILWVYRNMYSQVRAVRAGALPRTPTMAAYVVMPGRSEAVHGIA
jgi:hypothetical protein